jgi:hypothetical protein
VYDGTEKALHSEGQDIVGSSFTVPLSESRDKGSYSEAKFFFKVVANCGTVIGFFNSAMSAIEKPLKNSIKAIVVNDKIFPHISYSDGTADSPASQISLTLGEIYQAIVRFEPGTRLLTLEIYSEEGVLQDNVGVTIHPGNVDKDFTVDEVGIAQNNSPTGASLFLQSIFAVPTALDFPNLYCSPSEVQDLITILSGSSEITESQTRNIIKILSHAKLDSWFRALGYEVPFDMGEDTPPMIRSLAVRLSTYYALKKVYTGHTPNGIPDIASLKKEIMADLLALAESDCNCGAEMELIDKDGNIIEPKFQSERDFTSTTLGEEEIFGLDDYPDVGPKCPRETTSTNDVERYNG